MEKMTDKRKKKRIITGSVVLFVLAVLIFACVLYLNDYYPADWDAINRFAVEEHVTVERLADDPLVFEPEGASVGLIFYPGGKVEYTAYIPLMKACANRGILCVLVEMPFHLAVFDINAADGIQEQFPEIDRWYIAGHSLGGSMAASYVSKHVSEYEGLILLGSYSTADLSSSSIKVLSVYGSEDKVLNRENYEANKSNLPEAFTEYVIEGGCHAYFGMYGSQEGDGTPTITNQEQIEWTAGYIRTFCE